MWSTCSMLVSGINTWPPTGSARPSATDSMAPAFVMAIQNSGERKMRGFIVYSIGLRAAERSMDSDDVLEFVLTNQRSGAASIYCDHRGGKMNQSKFLAFNYDSSGLPRIRLSPRRLGRGACPCFHPRPWNGLKWAFSHAARVVPRRTFPINEWPLTAQPCRPSGSRPKGRNRPPAQVP